MSTYNYHPSIAAKFGWPIDPRNPTEDKSTTGFFKWENYKEKHPSGAELVNFKIDEVQNRSELYSKISLDLTIEAKFGLSNFKNTLNWEKEALTTTNTITYVAYGKKIYNEESIDGEFVFTEKGKRVWQAACQDGRIREFQKAAGTEYVTKMKRGSCVSIIYSFNTSSATLREKIKNKLEAEWTSGSVNMDFSKTLFSIDEGLSIYIEGFQTGVDKESKKKLSDIISSKPGNIVEIREIVSAILGDISDTNRESCPLIEFKTAPISSLEEIFLSKCSEPYNFVFELNNRIDKYCIDLSELSNDCFKKMKVAKELHSSWNKIDFKEGSEEIILAKIDEIKILEGELFNSYSKAINAIDLKAFNPLPSPIKSLNFGDVLNIPFIVPLPWGGSTISIKTNNEYGTFRTKFYPVIHIRFLNAIKYLYIIKDSIKFRLISKDELLQVKKDNGSFINVWDVLYEQKEVYIQNWFPVHVVNKEKDFHKSNLEKESKTVYEMEITLEDGTSHRIQIGNAAGLTPFDLSWYPTLSKEEVIDLEKRATGFFDFSK